MKNCEPTALPRSANRDAPAVMRQGPAAYLRNPIAGLDMMSPDQVVDAISLLSSILVADNRYRQVLASRKAPDGN